MKTKEYKLFSIYSVLLHRFYSALLVAEIRSNAHNCAWTNPASNKRRNKALRNIEHEKRRFDETILRLSKTTVSTKRRTGGNKSAWKRETARKTERDWKTRTIRRRLQLRFQQRHLLLVLCGTGREFEIANRRARASDGIDSTSNRVDILMGHFEFRTRLLLGRRRSWRTPCARSSSTRERTQRVLIVIDRPSIFRWESLCPDRQPGTSKAGQFPLAALIN